MIDGRTIVFYEFTLALVNITLFIVQCRGPDDDVSFGTSIKSETVAPRARYLKRRRDV